ncbi:MAG: hypothetical protein DWQ06_10185 [Calditrichaeota bacterium]|nr:MAG: hypothetical protein DWQ06_10185 [Calditrichota bacterium]
MLVKSFSLTILITLFLQNLLFAGAWTQGEGKYYQKFSLNILETDKEYGLEGDKQGYASAFEAQNGKFSDSNIGFYIEYGFTEKLTLISSLSAKRLNSKFEVGVNQIVSESITTTGLSDWVVGARFRILKLDPIVASIQNDVTLPFLYDKNDALALGNGNYANHSKIQLGASLYPLPVYLTGDFGYKIYSGSDMNNEMIYGFEIGFSYQNLLFKNSLDGIQNSKDISSMGSNSSGIVTSSGNQNSLKWSSGLIFEFKENMQLNLDFSRTLRGENTLAYNSFSLGIAFTN